MNTTPNSAMAQEFLQLLDASPDALFCFMAIGPDGAKPSPIVRTWHGKLNSSWWRTLQQFNTEQRCGVYVTVQQMNGEGRSEEDVVRFRAVYAELDDGLPDQPWPLEPSMIVESSPGRFHCWWIIEGEGLTYEEFRGIERRMVADWKSDKGVIDAARVLRLPGFLHQKNPDQPHLVRMIGGTRTRYTREQIVAAFPPILEPPSKSRKDSTGKKPGDTAELWQGGSCGDWRARISKELWADICKEGPEGKRSSHSYSVMLRLLALKLTDDDLLACATTAPACFAAKFIQRGDIRKEIARCRRKWQTRSAPFDSIEPPAAAGVEIVDKLTNAIAAAMFAHAHADRHKFNHSRSGWMTFTGVVWQQDRQGETLDVIAKFCSGLGNGSTTFARHVEALARNMPEFRVTQEMFDTDDYLLGTPVGYIDLRTGAMLPPDPARLVSKTTPVAPVKAPPKRWLQFLSEVTDGDDDLIHFLQRLFGYCLTGETREQVFAFIHGKPGTGKSTMVRAIQGAAGSYARSGHIAALLTPRNSDTSAPQPFLAALAGARLVVLPETKAAMVLDAPTIARVTGEDPVTLRDLHGKAFEFLPKFKCIIYGNEPPKISGSVPALARRTIVIRLHKIFKDAVGEGTNKVEVGLMKILESEFGGILQWMTDGCLQWQKIGLCVPPVVAESSRNFIANADTFARWLAEDVVADPAGRLWNRDATVHGARMLSGTATNRGVIRHSGIG